MNIFYALQLILLVLPTQLLGVPLIEVKKGNPLDGRIVGGFEATIQQFPHQISLQRNGRHICGAIVIHTQVLLTAAHCIDKQKPNAFLVRAGSTELYKGGDLIKVRSIISHEAYNLPSQLNNDIALIVLEEPLKFSRFIRALPLMTEKDVILPKTNLYVSGWGSTSSSVLQISPRLRYTTVHEIDHTKCTTSYKGSIKVTSTMICAGMEQGGRDSCQGDSGGPLITHVNGSMKLVGIVSWGISCANSAYPGVYTRISDYENWIKKQMSDVGGFKL